jgi:hypothetical protein
MFNRPQLATKYWRLALTKKPRHDKRLQRFGKGNEEGYAPLGSLSEHDLKAWLAKFQSNGSNISGGENMGHYFHAGYTEAITGVPCNPHTFGRTFVCLMRKSSVDTMTLKELSRW